MTGWLTAVAAGLRAWAAWLELRSRRLLLDEYERIEAEVAQYEKSLDELRRRGRHADAHALLLRQVRRAVLLEGVAGAFPRADVRGDGGAGDLGERPGGAGVGAGEPGPAGGVAAVPGHAVDGGR